MRIIAGRMKGRKLTPPMHRWPTRPTTEFAREGLFNLLSHRMDLATVHWLDLFGGTGIMCIEALSRGCPQATYVDRYRPAIRWLSQVSSDLELGDQLVLRQSDVKRYLHQPSDEPHSLVFADPPYDLPWLARLPDVIMRPQGHLADEGLCIIEHRSSWSFEGHERHLESRKYGDSTFSLFR